MFNQYPYINLNDFNLDYILKAIKEMRYEVTNFVSINAIKYADPIQWNITSQYEKNTIVIDPQTGTAYISVAAVPAGVALTRPEYWTVVFDLGSFVTRAAQNFTNRYEQDTTTTATFNSTAGDWLVWGDTLYIANVNITAGDSYVVGGNISRITIEEVKNAVMQLIADNYSAVMEIIGDLDDLTTTDKSNLVGAINELVSGLSDEVQARQDADGDLNDLTTTDKSNLVAAINEVNATGGGAISLIGDLDDLTTENRDNLVDAINETYGRTFDRYTVANIYIDGTDGDDDNDGLTNTAPMKTLEGAYSKYAQYTYVNIIIISDGIYEIGNNLDTNLRFYNGGHGSVITAQPGINATISGYFYWFGGHLEFWHITIAARIDFRNCSVVLGDENYSPTIDSIDIAYFTNSNINMVNCVINSPINTAFCNISIASNVIFNETVEDRVKIVAVATKITFNGGAINTTVASMAAAFIRAYGNTQVAVITMPTFTGKYGNLVWGNGAIVTLAQPSMNDTIESNTNSRGLNAFNSTAVFNSNFVSGQPIYILGAVNFNSYATAGKYYVNNASGSNRPVSDTGMLVIDSMSSTTAIQYFYPDSISDFKIYYRKYNNGSWSAWYALEGTAI